MFDCVQPTRHASMAGFTLGKMDLRSLFEENTSLILDP